MIERCYVNLYKNNMTSSVVYTGELRTLATHLQSGSTIETDAPTDNQGKGERFSPTDLIGTALAACIVTTMAIRGREFEDQLKGLNITTEKIMSSNPRKISTIKIIFRWPSTSIFNTDQQNKLIEIALSCPVKESIHPNIELEFEYNWVNQAY
jgi:uncharacterized OsmC-like protein